MSFLPSKHFHHANYIACLCPRFHSIAPAGSVIKSPKFLISRVAVMSGKTFFALFLRGNRLLCSVHIVRKYKR